MNLTFISLTLPRCVPNTKLALPGTGWPERYLCALGKAIWERGVDVEIVLSNPGSIPAGLKPMEAVSDYTNHDVHIYFVSEVKHVSSA